MGRLVDGILKAEKAEREIAVKLINDEEMRRLNKRFRGLDRTTDVLSFATGDLAISTETARRNARHYGVTYKKELQRLIVHGVLHILGYNHGKEMRHAEKIYQKF